MKESHTAMGKKVWRMRLPISSAKRRPILRSKNNAAKKRNAAKRRNPAWLFLLPSLVGTSIFIFIPFGDVVRRSFTEAFSGTFVGFDNYRTVFTNKAFELAMKNTFRFIGICIPLLLAGSLVMAIALKHLVRTKRLFQASFLIPMAVPVASVVLFWRLVFDRGGYLNGIIAAFGVQPIDWMNQNTAFGILVFCYLWKNMGYFVVLWLAGLEAIPVSYYEAAQVDGANGWKSFRYITIPQLIPTLFVVTILGFVNSFKVFREAYLISGDYPHESIYLLQHLFNNWFANLDVQKMSTAAVVLAVVISAFICVMLFLERKIGSED